MATNITVAGSRGGSITAGRGKVSKWHCLDLGWVKVNTDGAANADETSSIATGVFRDSHGEWILGFQRLLGKGSTLNSKLWAIFHGL